VEELAREILANSWGTNRIDKRLIADRDERTRAEALSSERMRSAAAEPTRRRL